MIPVTDAFTGVMFGLLLVLAALGFGLLIGMVFMLLDSDFRDYGPNIDLKWKAEEREKK